MSMRMVLNGDGRGQFEEYGMAGRASGTSTTRQTCSGTAQHGGRDHRSCWTDTMQFVTRNDHEKGARYNANSHSIILVLL